MHLGFASAGAVWLCIWNSDHVVLKFNIRTSASPWRQRSYWGLRVTKDAYFSLLTHTKQLLLVTFCDMLAGIEVSFWADGTGRTDKRTDGWTDRREVWNSYLDSRKISNFQSVLPKLCKIIFRKILNLNNYFRLHVCLSVLPSVRPYVHPYVRPSVTLSFFSISCSRFTKCHL